MIVYAKIHKNTREKNVRKSTPSPTGSSDSECPICFYPFEENDYYDVTSRGKRIHIVCLEGWKQK